MSFKPVDRWADEGPGFNRPVADAVYSTIMKMDVDEAVMFSRLLADAVLGDDLMVHGELIAKTLQVEHLERAQALKARLAQTAVRKARAGENADVELVALDELSKSFIGDMLNRVSGNSADKRAERARRQQRGAANGQFVRQTTDIVHESDKAHSVAHENRLGIPPADADWGAIDDAERAAYQQAYHQVAELVKPYQGLPQGSALVHLIDNLGDEKIAQIPHGDTATLPARDFDPRDGRKITQVKISVIPPMDEQGAAFSLFDSLGFPTAGATAARATERGALNPDRVERFGEKWNQRKDSDQHTPSQKVFRRLDAGSSLIQDTLGPAVPPHALMALKTAQHVAQLGPRAQTVLAPTLDRAAYRYRGTERKPAPELEAAMASDAREAGRHATAANASYRKVRESGEARDAALNRNFRNHRQASERISYDWDKAGVQAKKGLIGRGDLKNHARHAQRELARINIERTQADKAAHAAHAAVLAEHEQNVALGAQQHKARHAEIMARGYEGDDKRWHSGEVLAYFKTRVPSAELNELHLASGTIPPSEGVILNSKGEVTSQAVGYGEDHYLPFTLRSLRQLRGGSYIRTRTWGGPTPEDIRTSLLGGAKELTVVSNNGVFNIEFDPTFKGGRRHNDKAHRMIGRYEHLLDAVRSKSVSRAEIDPARMDALREKAGKKFNPERNSEAFNKEFARLVADERKNPELSGEQLDEVAGEYLRELAAQHSTKGAGASADDLITEIADRNARRTHSELSAAFRKDDTAEWREKGRADQRSNKAFSPEERKAALAQFDVPSPPSLEALRHAEVQKLTRANPQEQAQVLAAYFGADAGLTSYMDKAKTANKSAVRLMQLDGPGYEAAMLGLKEQFPYYIKDVTFRRWDNAPQRTDTGFVRVGALRPGAAKAGLFGSKVAADTIRGQAARGQTVREEAKVTATAPPVTVATATPAVEESAAKLQKRVDAKMIQTLLAQKQFGQNATLGEGPDKVSIANASIVGSLNKEGNIPPEPLKPFYVGDVTEDKLLDELERNPAGMHAKIAAAVQWFHDNTAFPVNDAEHAAALKDFETKGKATAAVKVNDPTDLLLRPDREYELAWDQGPEYTPGSGATTKDIANAYLTDPLIGDLVKAGALPVALADAAGTPSGSFKADAAALRAKLTRHDEAINRYKARDDGVGEIPHDEAEHDQQVRGLVQANTLYRRYGEAERIERDASEAQAEKARAAYAEAQAEERANAPEVQEQMVFPGLDAQQLAEIGKNPELAEQMMAGMNALRAANAPSARQLEWEKERAQQNGGYLS